MRTKLASLNLATGKISVSKRVKNQRVRQRIKRHEQVFLKAKRSGASFTKARMLALKAEHKGMTKKQVQQYEGKLGALARWT